MYTDPADYLDGYMRSTALSGLQKHQRKALDYFSDNLLTVRVGRTLLYLDDCHDPPQFNALLDVTCLPALEVSPVLCYSGTWCRWGFNINVFTVNTRLKYWSFSLIHPLFSHLSTAVTNATLEDV